MRLTKTNFLLYKNCPENAWVKIFEPKIYYSKQLTDFDKMIMETGNEIDELARELFPGGILIENRDNMKASMEAVNRKEKIIYQPVFYTEKFEAIADIIVWNEEHEAYDIYEAKSTNSGNNKKSDDETYKYDLAFQANVLKNLSVPVNKTYIIRLNSDYVRQEKLNIRELLIIEDFTKEVTDMQESVLGEMENAQKLLKLENRPSGSCCCITKGRSAHCSTFGYLNPDIPEYSVHDISRIGLSKKKLADLIDSRIYSIYDVPKDFELTEIQRNQIDVAQSKKVIIKKVELEEFLNTVKYPISFLDYETFPSAIPRFIGYKPYDQIPFQFSLHVLRREGHELEHYEFLHSESNNPDLKFIKALNDLLPIEGSVIVWNKQFESGINTKLSERNSDFSTLLKAINDRMIDLELPFKKQFYVHPGFVGKTSIKKVLPTLAPDFSYKILNIQEGGTASQTWNKITSGQLDKVETDQKIKDLLAYCNLDTLAMYEILKHCATVLK